MMCVLCGALLLDKELEFYKDLCRDCIAELEGEIELCSCRDLSLMIGSNICLNCGCVEKAHI